MRKIIRTLLMIILFLGILVGMPLNKSYASNDIKVLLEGQELKFDVAPQIIEGRTLLPLRVIFEVLGLEVGWDDATRLITGITEGKEIILKLDSKNAKVNGIDKTLDVSARAINGRTMVPVRFIAESLDMNVIWNQESKTVKISKDNIIDWKYAGYEGGYPYKEYEKKYVNGVETSETRYNGKNHEVGPETRVLSDFNKYVKFQIDNNNYLDFNYSEKKIIVKKHQTLYYDIDIVITNLYYNLDNKQMRVEENHTIYTDESNIISSDNEAYIGSIIKELRCYATGYDAMMARHNAKILRNPYYNDDLIYAKNENTLLEASIAKKQKQNKELADIINKELQANNNVPIKILESNVTNNSIGTPEVTLTFKNLSNKTIKAYEMVLYCYDDFNRPVNKFLGNSNRFDGISQNNNLASGEIQYDTWTLSLYDLTTQVKNIKIINVAFTDGTSWKAK